MNYFLDPFKDKPWIIIDRLADIILSCVNGCIVEIGIGESSIILTKHAEKFNRKFYTCDRAGKRCDWVRNNPQTQYDKLIVYHGRSLNFIKDFDDTPAIVFIDGDHKIDTVLQEFEFFIKILSIGGVMFFHDTCPMQGYYERKLEKKGIENEMSTWRLKSVLKSRDDIEVFTWPYTASNCGLTMILKKDITLPFYRL